MPGLPHIGPDAGDYDDTLAYFERLQPISFEDNSTFGPSDLEIKSSSGDRPDSIDDLEKLLSSLFVPGADFNHDETSVNFEGPLEVSGGDSPILGYGIPLETESSGGDDRPGSIDNLMNFISSLITSDADYDDIQALASFVRLPPVSYEAMPTLEALRPLETENHNEYDNRPDSIATTVEHDSVTTVRANHLTISTEVNPWTSSTEDISRTSSPDDISGTSSSDASPSLSPSLGTKVSKFFNRIRTSSLGASTKFTKNSPSTSPSLTTKLFQTFKRTRAVSKASSSIITEDNTTPDDRAISSFLQNE